MHRVIVEAGVNKLKISTHLRFSVKKGVLRNFAKLTGKPLCQSLFLKKVASIKPATPLDTSTPQHKPQHLWTTASERWYNISDRS